MTGQGTLLVMRRGKPSMSEAEADRVRAVMRRLLEERYAGNRTSLGKAIGMSQSAVTQIIGTPKKNIAPKNRPSYETATAIARLARLPERFWEGPATAPEEPAPVRAYEIQEQTPLVFSDSEGTDAELRARAAWELVHEDRLPAADVHRIVGDLAFHHGRPVTWYDYYREAKRALRAETRPDKPRLGERSFSEAERILESDDPLFVEEDEDGRLRYSSLPPHQPEREREPTSAEGEEHGGKGGRSARKLPRASKASR